MIKKIFRPIAAMLFVCTMLFSGLPATAQTLQWGWAKAINGGGNETIARIAADSRNGIYTLGYFNSSTITTGSISLSNPNTGQDSYFLIKYDTLGNALWGISIVSNGSLIPLRGAIVTDANSDLILACQFSGTTTIGSTTLTSSGGTDILLAKISGAGNLSWVKQFTGSGNDDPNALNVDAAGNIYLAGRYSSNNFTIGSTVVTLPPGLSRNLFYCKLDAGGNSLWVKQSLRGNEAEFTYISTEENGKLVLCGGIFNTTNFNPMSGIGMTTLYASPFVLETNGNGDYINQTLTGSFTREQARSARWYNNTVLQTSLISFTGSPAFIGQASMYNLTNAQLTSTAANGGFSPGSNSTGLTDILADKNGRIFTVGTNFGNNDYGNGIVLNSSGPSSDFLVLRLDNTLVPQEIMASLNQPAVSKGLNAIALDTFTNRQYVAGSFSGGASFVVGNNTLSNAGASEGFVAQLTSGPAAPAPLSLKAGADRTTCYNIPVTIGVIAGNTPAAGASGGTPPYSYAWSPANLVANPAVLTTTTTLTTDTSLVLTVTDAAGGVAKDTVRITVNPTPPVPVVSANGPTTFCAGGSVTLTASAGISYVWSNGATTQSITVNIAGSYTVQVINIAACLSPASAPTVVTVNPASVAPAITAGGATTFCQGGSVTLTASTGSSYLWSNGATTQSITVNTGGSYTVQVTNAAGCQSVASAPTVVTVNPVPPVPAITQTGNTLTTGTASSYQWYFNGNLIPGATQQSYTYTVGGVFTVTVTNAAGCPASSNPYTGARMAGTGLRSGQVFYHQVYPNPVRSNAVIAYELPAAATISIFVTDSRGARVLTLADRRQQAAGRRQVNIGSNNTSLLRGNYFVVFIIDGERVVQPILVL